MFNRNEKEKAAETRSIQSRLDGWEEVFLVIASVLTIALPIIFAVYTMDWARGPAPDEFLPVLGFVAIMITGAIWGALWGMIHHRREIKIKSLRKKFAYFYSDTLDKSISRTRKIN